ncbi:phosphomannomutase [Apostasia shenzhenica]|uniref:phosphoglucomutase (alpha-D-glucose-1,6-bisphosphate-dependent) n=1 Tax=Apostasia shenzhenica TaxID=1088818 RepID=A0A2I0AUE3_9ASPA|nr:phosphomannomutase [Apostasia shenzhenica]
MAAAAAAAAAAVVSPSSCKLKPKSTRVLTSSPVAGAGFSFALRRSQRTFTSSSTDAASARPMVADGEEAEEAAGEFILRLQNGPDVRGVALEGEKGRAVDLTPPAVEALAESFEEWVAEKMVGKIAGSGDLRVSVGRDPRVSGPRLSAAAFAGLAKAKCRVFDMGLATTPACFMSTVLHPFAYDASIMITASHLPPTRNGLKFFTREGGLRPGEVEEICRRAARKYSLRKMGLGSTAAAAAAASAPVIRVDFMTFYAKHLRDVIIEKISHPQFYDTPLSGFKVIVNAGNGSGGFFAWDVLEKLGADTSGSLHLDPDGTFPNHVPNPADPTAMALTRAAVLRHDADLGVVFDTDVDRSGVVDGSGVAINGDRLIALMAAIVLKERPGTTIVTDARTSAALTRFIAGAGGRHCLYRVGYRNVIDKGVQLNRDGVETNLMMETTGHGALKENYFLDDGAYMVVKMIIEMVRTRLAGSSEGIGSLIEDLDEPIESVELRLDVRAQPKDAKHVAAEAVEAFRKSLQEGKLSGWELDACGDCWVSDGCLVDSGDAPAEVDARMYRAKISDEKNGQYGWLHMRQSVHSPTVAVNMQSSVSGGCRAAATVFRDRFLIPNGMEKMLNITQVDHYARRGSLD